MARVLFFLLFLLFSIAERHFPLSFLGIFLLFRFGAALLEKTQTVMIPDVLNGQQRFLCMDVFGVSFFLLICFVFVLGKTLALI